MDRAGFTLQEPIDSSTAEHNIKPKRSFYAARDLYKYRHQYPNFKDLRCQNDMCNLRFYMNKIPFKPDGVNIEEILNKWKGDYEKLEHNHTYIQWLFPLREQGLNFYAKELTSYEIEEFKKTKEAIKRFILAYKMMLDFFGIQLINKNGNVSRATNWKERFQHLNESQHNYLRITRILKSLGELGYENFKLPLVKLFLQESIVANTIPNMKQSALEYFVYTIKERRQRRKLLRFACLYYKPPEHFIWGAPNKLKVEENKTFKRSTTPSAQKKQFHTEKILRPDTVLHNPESSKTECAEVKESETTQSEETAEANPDNVIEACNNVTVTTESISCLADDTHSECSNSETDLTDLKDGLKGTNNTRCCAEIVIVESADEENKDCMCSLSPTALNIVDTIKPTEEEIETSDLIQNHEAK
ncbi:hypothetical protein GDO86_009879 [Hymenochirus boettgeri]|uniref:Opioid growth factor receptor (OGFr) conserved domain-containing protein n=1 Tax=Hymenochirus boettgeri TaxID=247094 RepID=A0A8T2JMC3_9PIPI|nr:hypothetical protein GDO86_009879 [Hymenochirus boettgeri]